MATVLISVLLLFLNSRHWWTRNGLHRRLCQRFHPLEQSQESRKRKEGFSCFVFATTFKLSPPFLPTSKTSVFLLSLLTNHPPTPKVFTSFHSEGTKKPPKWGQYANKEPSIDSDCKGVHWLEASVCNNLQGPSIHHWAPLTHGHNNRKFKVTSRSLSLASYFRWFHWQLLRRENNSPQSKGTLVRYPRIYSKRYI